MQCSSDMRHNCTHVGTGNKFGSHWTAKITPREKYPIMRAHTKLLSNAPTRWCLRWRSQSTSKKKNRKKRWVITHIYLKVVASQYVGCCINVEKCLCCLGLLYNVEDQLFATFRFYYLSIYPSIHPSIHPSIYLSIYLSVYIHVAHLALHVVCNVVRCVSSRDLPHWPRRVIGEVGGEDTDTQLTLCMCGGGEGGGEKRVILMCWFSFLCHAYLWVEIEKPSWTVDIVEWSEGGYGTVNVHGV